MESLFRQARRSVTQSGAAFGNEGTDMALHHPIDDRPAARKDGPHPALCLLLGFAVIAGGATLVHIVFNALV